LGEESDGDLVFVTYAENRDRLMIPVVFPNPATHDEGDVLIEDMRVNGSLGNSKVFDVVDGGVLEARARRVETLTSHSGWPGSKAQSSHLSRTVLGSSPCVFRHGALGDSGCGEPF